MVIKMVNPIFTEFALECLDKKIAGDDAPEVCHLKYILEPEGRCCSMQGPKVDSTYRCMAKESLQYVKEKIEQGYSLREVNDLLREKIDSALDFLEGASKQKRTSILKCGTTTIIAKKE